MPKMRKSKKKIILFLSFLILCIAMVVLKRKINLENLAQMQAKGGMKVAKWSFLVNGGSSSITNINLTNSYKENTLVENRIAPGTKGSFDIVIDTTHSEVGVNYEVTFINEKAKPHNLQFTYDNHTVSTMKELEPFLTGIIEADKKEKIKTMTIMWKWPYETGNSAKEKEIQDAKDTQNGIELEQYQFDILITGRQVKPIT